MPIHHGLVEIPLRVDGAGAHLRDQLLRALTMRQRLPIGVHGVEEARHVGVTDEHLAERIIDGFADASPRFSKYYVYYLAALELVGIAAERVGHLNSYLLPGTETRVEHAVIVVPIYTQALGGSLN